MDETETFKINAKCYSIEARYELKQGSLRCVKPYVFPYKDRITIEINEGMVRTIRISSNDEIMIKTLYKYLVDIERLLNILDGAFIPLKDIEILGKGKKIDYKIYADQIIAQRLKYFQSSKIYSINIDRLIEYERVLDGTLLESWKYLVEELGVINQLYLYACSDCGLTIDVICAFLIQISEPLVEYLKQKKIFANKPRYLKDCIMLLIKKYGCYIFRQEIQCNLEEICKRMVNTRVNIMHIKKKQKQPCLNSKECILYSIKMTYLYRVVILNLLSIEDALFIKRLTSRINYLDTWENVLQGLVDDID